MNAFDNAWAIVKMAWKPEQIDHSGLFGDQHGPLPEPVDAGLYYPPIARTNPEWFHKWTYDTKGRKLNQWHMSHDQDWALNPFISPERGGRWIQVDRMMKPLLEALWAQGINTKFSDTGGDLRDNPLYPYNEVLEEKSIYGGRQRPTDTHEGYLWFGPEGIPEQAKGFPRMEQYWKEHEQWIEDTPWIDDRDFGDDREKNPEGETLRWEASDDLSNLRQIYEVFGVPFPEEHMKDGGYQWR